MVIHLNLNSRKGASKIISLVVVVGLILSALTLGLVYYPKVLQNNEAMNDESDNSETPSFFEPITEPSSEPVQGNLGSIIDVLSTNITEWRNIGSDYIYYQVQFRIKNIGNEDLEIKYVVVDTHLATEKSTKEIQPLINSRALSEIDYLTEIQCKIIPYGGETNLTIYTENLQNETEYTIRLHFTNDEDSMFNLTTNITNADVIEYPKFVKIEIQSVVCTRHPSGGNWTIAWKIKNTGTATATLELLSINGYNPYSYGASPPVPDGQITTDMNEDALLPSGRAITIKIFIDDTVGSFKAGTTIRISVYTAGNEYIKLVELV